MDDKVPDFLEFEEPILSSLPKNENALKLDDPPEQDPFDSTTSVPHHQNAEKIEIAEDLSEDLLNLGEPPLFREDEEKVEISKFAEEFVEPIVKEAIAMHKSEAEDDESDVHVESYVDKKSDKSSSDDGFEYVKKEEVETDDKQQDYENQTSEAEEVKRDLEDLVFQEEMRLESTSNNVLHDVADNYESDDAVSHEQLHEDIDQKEVSPAHHTVEQIDEVEVEERANVAFSAHSEFDEKVDNAIEYEARMELADVENVKIESDIYAGTNDLDSFGRCETFVDKSAVEQLVKTESPEETEHHSVSEETVVMASIMQVDHDINGKCKDIISWTHPVSSALAFSILMFIELGLMMDYSIISLLAYSGLLLMVASFLYKIAVNFKLINTQSSMNCIITFNKEDVEYCVNVTLNWVDYFHREIKSIAYVKSFSKNLKVFAMLWALTYVGQMFNLQSLIFIGSLLLFSMPVVYSKFEKEINEAVDNIRGQINGTINKIKSKSQRLFGAAK